MRFLALPEGLESNATLRQSAAALHRRSHLETPQYARSSIESAGARADAATVASGLLSKWGAQGVIAADFATALGTHPDLVRAHLGTALPPEGSWSAAASAAIWQGGSFIYVPPGVHVSEPIQPYDRSNAARIGPNQRTLIVAEAGSSVEIIDGCPAPIYTADHFRLPTTEIIAYEGATVRYTSLLNYSSNVTMVVTRRAVVHAGATVHWSTAHLGAGRIVGVPSVHLLAPDARADLFAMSFIGPGNRHEFGAEVHGQTTGTAASLTARAMCVEDGIAETVLTVSGAVGLPCPPMTVDSQTLRLAIGRPHTGAKRGLAQTQHPEEWGVVDWGQPGSRERIAHQAAVVNFIQPAIRHLPAEYGIDIEQVVDLYMDGSIG